MAITPQECALIKEAISAIETAFRRYYVVEKHPMDDAKFGILNRHYFNKIGTATRPLIGKPRRDCLNAEWSGARASIETLILAVNTLITDCDGQARKNKSKLAEAIRKAFYSVVTIEKLVGIISTQSKTIEELQAQSKLTRPAPSVPVSASAPGYTTDTEWDEAPLQTVFRPPAIQSRRQGSSRSADYAVPIKHSKSGEKFSNQAFSFESPISHRRSTRYGSQEAQAASTALVVCRHPTASQTHRRFVLVEQRAPGEYRADLGLAVHASDFDSC